MSKRIAIVAGEASGDLLGAHLMQSLTPHLPKVQWIGIGGPRMQAAGLDAVFPQEPLAVRGYVEVLGNLRRILAIRRGLRRLLVRDPPDLFIGVDAPDFNLPLEAQLKGRGIRTVHYVSPSIWAWRPERIRRIGRAVDHMLTIFPFEADIYHRAGIAATYTGHPLADLIDTTKREDARVQMRLPRAAPVFALLPGSRQSELKAHSSLLLRVAQQVHALLPEARFLVPLATRETREHFERAIATADAHALPVTVLFGHAQLALASADVALVASGTATLEAALMRCPMVITYRMPALSWRLMRRKALIPYVGLPNILAGEFIVPELLQDEATPENLSQAMLNWYRAREARELLEERMAALHALLRRDSPRRLAAAILPLLGATARAVPPGVQATGHADSPALSALRR